MSIAFQESALLFSKRNNKAEVCMGTPPPQKKNKQTKDEKKKYKNIKYWWGYRFREEGKNRSQEKEIGFAPGKMTWRTFPTIQRLCSLGQTRRSNRCRSYKSGSHIFFWKLTGCIYCKTRVAPEQGCDLMRWYEWLPYLSILTSPVSFWSLPEPLRPAWNWYIPGISLLLLPNENQEQFRA